MNSTQKPDQLGPGLGKRLVAAVVGFVLLANLMCWSFPLIRTFPWANEFLVTTISGTVFGLFVIAGILGLADWVWWKRFLLAISLHAIFFAVNMSSFVIFFDGGWFVRMPFPILYMYLFSVAGLAGPFVLVRVLRNVRISREVDSEAVRSRLASRMFEFVPLILYWCLTVGAVFAFASWSNSVIPPASSAFGGAGLFIPALFLLSSMVGGVFLFCFSARRYVLVSTIVTLLLAIVAAPAIGLFFYFVSAPAQRNLSFFFYSLELMAAAYATITFAILAAMLIVGLRLMGYQLIWPKTMRSAPETREQESNVPDPWD